MKTVKRITRILSDKNHERLHTSPTYHSREFSVEGQELTAGLRLSLTNFVTSNEWLWDKLGRPHKIRVTITALDDDDK